MGLGTNAVFNCDDSSANQRRTFVLYTVHGFRLRCLHQVGHAGSGQPVGNTSAVASANGDARIPWRAAQVQSHLPDPLQQGGERHLLTVQTADVLEVYDTDAAGQVLPMCILWSPLNGPCGPTKSALTHCLLNTLAFQIEPV